MASVTTSEFVRTTSRLDAPPFSLLEQKGLIARLIEEFARARSEFAQDPRGFIRAIFADDTKDTKRRRKIRIVLVYTLVAHAAVIALIAFFGWHHLIQPKEAASNLKVDTILPTKSLDKTEATTPHGKDGGGEVAEAMTARCQRLKARCLKCRLRLRLLNLSRSLCQRLCFRWLQQ